MREREGMQIWMEGSLSESHQVHEKGPQTAFFVLGVAALFFFQTSCLRLTSRLLTLGMNIIVVVVSTNKRHVMYVQSSVNY